MVSKESRNLLKPETHMKGILSKHGELYGKEEKKETIQSTRTDMIRVLPRHED